MHGDSSNQEVDQGEWASLTQAAERLGWTRERLRSLIRRDHGRRIEVMRDNRGELRVRLGAWLMEVAYHGRPTVSTDQGDHGRPRSGDHPYDALVTELRERLAKAEADRERLAQELMAARERAAAADGEVRALRDAGEREVRTLRDALYDLSRRLDRAEERLALPWWRKLLG